MKQFIRNFNKQKVVGLLNISSLSLGVMVAVIVGLYCRAGSLFQSPFVVKRIYGKNLAQSVDFPVGRNYSINGYTADYRFSNLDRSDNESGENIEKRVNRD